MCGIAGYIGFSDGIACAMNANKVQAHRGPDSQNYWSNDHISLAHQRLSIIDLSDQANQPLHKNGYVIIYNGELYNYKEIKKKLRENYGSVFSTQSDTEVILEAYSRLGEDCLKQFQGMFAFAIYNKTTQETFIARDCFGIKPLFYSFIDGNLCFASELKTLTKVKGFDKTINQESLVSLLNYLWIPGDESIFVGTHKLPPGHFMRITKEKKTIIRQYWELSAAVDSNRTEKETIEELQCVLEKSIERHLVADVPVSSFLSGGVDSSLISVIASKKVEKLSTYTITTSEEDKKIEQMPDDQKYARSLARQHSFDAHEIELSPDIVKLLPQIVRTLDEPIGDPAAINTYLMCEMARKHGTKVILSGMGADELFFGYQRHRAMIYAKWYRKIPSLIRATANKIIQTLPVRLGSRGILYVRWAKRFLKFASLPPDIGYMRSYSYYEKKQLNQLLKESSQKEIEAIINNHSKIFNEKYNGDIINQICNTDIQFFMRGLNLTYTDRASMAASVEVRVPFIDKSVVEFAMTIPGRLKFKKNQTKYILKKAAEKYLDHEIIYRKKASFGAPIRSWISHDLRDMIDELLSQKRIESRGLFNYEFVKNLIESDRMGKEDNAYQIYQLLTIELWMQAFLDE